MPPNLYGRDPAIQVSGTKGTDADLSVLDKVNATLKDITLLLNQANLKTDKSSFVLRMLKTN